MNTARQIGFGVGTSTAGLVYGGSVPGITANTETWDGSSWTEVANLPAAEDGHSGAGTQTAALSFGGAPAITASNIWDGSSWSTRCPLSKICALSDWG